jgi:hypothetical protein
MFVILRSSFSSIFVIFDIQSYEIRRLSYCPIIPADIAVMVCYFNAFCKGRKRA